MKDAKEAHWAVLVAGSNGWWNYRHQSDTCHAYNILIKNGMPAERIITLAYDDIANDYSNPFKGQVFNKPDPTGKGFDVYKNCKIDYTAEDVTPDTFLNVLKGDAKANQGKGNGRVLASTANDKVFVYFTDHGATGLIAFPSGELYADDLINTLKYMHDNQKYKRLVFYLEACESGSMFSNILPTDWEIYATTAANPSESSWATYCSPNDKVNGKSIGSCLGDEYSVNWMEDTEGAESGKKLQKQFEDIKTKTKGSHVMQYGIVSWTDEALTNYQGDVAQFSLFDKFYNRLAKSANKLYLFFSKNKKAKVEKYRLYLEEARSSMVDSRDTKLHYLMNRHKDLNNFQTESALMEEVTYRKNVEDFFSHFNEKFAISNYTGLDHVIHFDCLKRSVNALKTSCKSLWGEYTLKYIKNLYTACELTHDSDAVESYLRSAC